MPLLYPGGFHKDRLLFKLLNIDDLYKYKIEYGYKKGLFSRENRNIMHSLCQNITKENYYEDRRLYNLSSTWDTVGDVFPSKYPSIIYIGLLNECNATCNHCPWFSKIYKPYNISGYFDSKIQLDSDKVYEIIDFAIKGKSKVIFSGPGEPLLDCRIFEFIKYAKNGGLYVSVPTNGILLDLLMLDKLINLGVNDISMGIYFSNGNYKDGVTTDKLKLQILQNLKFLKENNCDIACALFVQYEIEFYKEALDFIYEIDEYLPEYFSINLYNPNDKYWDNNSNTIHNTRHSCGFISSSLYVFPDGSVSACEIYRSMLSSRNVSDLSYGNIYNSSLDDIWNGEIHKTICHKHKNGDNTGLMLDVCKSCQYWWNENG